jgi:hypothetical protein
MKRVNYMLGNLLKGSLFATVAVLSFSAKGTAFCEDAEMVAIQESILLEKIAYHEQLAHDYKIVNRYLTIKYPISFANPEYHLKKASKYRSDLEKLKNS